MRILVIAAPLLALAACDMKPTEVGPGAETRQQKAAAARKAEYDAAHPVRLPPSIAASRQYRCADNSLALVEWFSDGTSAMVRTDARSMAVRVEAKGDDDAMTGGGFTLTGTKDARDVRFGSPAHPKPQKCHV